MTTNARDLIVQYYNALFTGSPKEAVAFFDDAVEYTCYAPVNIFPHLGFRKGKAALLETIESLHHHFDNMSYVPKMLIADGNDVASLIDARLRRRNDQRTVQANLAHFTRFKDNKIVEHRLFLDACDALEQLVGCELDFSRLLDPSMVHMLKVEA